jgi:steroid delta-isomerase-like uncharacterized protein
MPDSNDVLASNKALVSRFIEKVFNEGDEAAMESLCDKQIVDHNPFGKGGNLSGPDRTRMALRHIRGAFPDLTLTVQEMLADGDRVVVRGRLTGTHAGYLMGFPASGKPIDVQIIDIYRCADGKIAERWGVFEGLNLAMQVGLLPRRSLQPAEAET